MPAPRLHASHAARQAAYRKRQQQARQQELVAKGLPPSPALATLPGKARWEQAIAQAACLLEMVSSEMQNYFDERSEAWQESERAEEHRQRIEALEEIVSALQNA